MSMWRVSEHFTIKLHQNLMRDWKLNNRINPAIAYERVLCTEFLFSNHISFPYKNESYPAQNTQFENQSWLNLFTYNQYIRNYQKCRNTNRQCNICATYSSFWSIIIIWYYFTFNRVWISLVNCLNYYILNGFEFFAFSASQ